VILSHSGGQTYGRGPFDPWLRSPAGVSGGQTLPTSPRKRHRISEKAPLSCAGPGEVAEWLKAAPC